MEFDNELPWIASVDFAGERQKFCDEPGEDFNEAVEHYITFFEQIDLSCWEE